VNARISTTANDSNVSDATPLPSVASRRKKKYSETSSKLEFVEGMRALAALYVVIGHFCSMVDPMYMRGGKSQLSPWLRAIMSPFCHGHLAVAAFIVISGFCLQYGLYQRGDGRVYGLGKFFKRRALRILPAYYACLALSIGVCYWVTWPNRETPPFDIYVKASSGVPVTTDSFFAHLFLVHNLSTDWMFRINGVLWSIAIEAQLYFLFPWLILLMQKKSPLALLAGVGLPTILVTLLIPDAGKTYTWFAILFAVGMLSAHFVYRPHRKLGMNPTTALVLGLMGVIGTICINSYYLSQGIRLSTGLIMASDLTFGLSAAAFIYSATATPGSLLDRFFSMRFLVWVGVFSYSLYLLHHPILQVLYVYRPDFIQSPDAALGYLIALGLPVTIALSWSFSWLFERPFVKSFIATTSAGRVPRIPLPLKPVQAIYLRDSYAYADEPQVELDNEAHEKASLL
jgi:peptidoglycan/LPS O-acetylase OafA/YrhL